MDSVGRAVITGQTISADFPVTAQAYQRLFAGSQDCFVTMLAADGKSLVFSTFLGGSDLDNCRAIALNPSGAITVVGSTRSSDFPVLGPFQSRNAGFLDGFVLQMNGTGSALLSSSYLGGIGEDQLSSVALDSSGYVYVAGTTSTQANFPGTAAGVITKGGAGRNGFACKIAPSLVSLNWCSIVGGSGEDYVNGMALLPTGELVVAGQTTSVNLPVVNAVQSVFQGASDGWFAVLNSAGSQWETVSYTGGAAANTVNAVLAFQDRILLAGSTTALNLPVTTGAFQPAAGGGGDGFLQEVAIGSGLVLNGVYPSSGFGFAHSLSLVVTDPAGGQSVQTVQVNVSNPNSTSNACVVTFTVASRTLSLLNDAGSTPVGTTTAGSNAVLQNSQCSVAAATSTLSVSGNSVSLRLSLTYKPAFASLGAGAGKYVSVLVSDTQGKTLLVPQAASWFLSAQQPPAIVSLSPASGKGSSQSFSLAVSDPAGASDLASVQLLFGSTAALANGCAVTYIATQNQLALSGDSGATYAGALAPGQAATISNSQCVLNGAGSSVQLSGKSFVMTVNLQFTASFAILGSSPTKSVFALPLTTAGVGPMGGLTAVGTWTVPLPVPTVDAITPSSGVAANQSFALSVSDPAGASDLSTVQLLFGSSSTSSNACSVAYYVQQKIFSLSNDAGNNSVGTLSPGQATTLSNSQCTLVGSGSGVTVSGKTLVMTVSIQFAPAFAILGAGARKIIYALPLTASGAPPSGGITSVGTWTVPLPVPTVSGITPASGQGSAQSFVLSVSDPAGANDFSTVQLLFGSSSSSSNTCAVAYYTQQKLFALSNDAGNNSVGTLSPGQAATLSNSQCTLVGSGSGVTISGQSLVMTVSIQFAPTFSLLGAGPTKNIYALPLTASGAPPTGGLAMIGTWTVPLPVPTVVGVTPSAGVGAAQAFTLSVSDLAGASDLATVQMLLGSSEAANNACAVTYSVQQGTLSLSNDAGTASAGTIAPGQATTISNSQCTLAGSASSVNLSGNTLTLVASLQFNKSFGLLGSSAVKGIYAKVLNAAGLGTAGYVQVGTWVVPQVIVKGSAVPAALAPLSGQGMSQAFTLMVSDTAGASDLALVHLIVSGPANLDHSCWVTYNASTQTVGLVTDATGAYVGYLAPGAATSYSNSQCTLLGNGTSVQLVGNLLTMTVNLQFNPAFSSIGNGSAKTIYAYLTPHSGASSSGLIPIGTWILGKSLSSPPAAVSITPSSGQASSQAFALTVSDPLGASDLGTVQLLFGTSTRSSNACLVTYIAQQGTLALTSDAGTSYAGYVTPGQVGTTSNSQCSLNGSGSSIQKSGNSLTMTANLQFTSAFAASGGSSAKTIYALPANIAGQVPPGGLAPLGTWSIPQTSTPGAGPLSLVSLTPASGLGAAQAFTLVVADSAGAADLSAVHFIVSGPAVLTNACWITYYPANNTFGLVDDTATVYSGYVAPGQGSKVLNSQCTLSGVGSSAQFSGNLLTLTMNLTFSASFSSLGNGATKTTYAFPVLLAGKSPTTLVPMGTWTLP